MALNQLQKDNLYKGLGLFLEAMRPYAVSVLQAAAGDKWAAWFVESLNPQQQESWRIGLRQGTTPDALIDFHYLKPFALKYKDLLKKDFGPKEVHNVPTWFGEIADVRHQIAHFREIEDDQATNTWIKMVQIARTLAMTELVEALGKLREARPDAPAATGTTGHRPWFQVVSPHLDIRQGRLDESVFAANLAEVAMGNGREIYNNPAVFFSKTFFTAGLRTVARRVVKGLNGEEDAENRVISLQTGFGGGKTHTLITLYHLAKWGKNAVHSGDAASLVQHTGAPNFDNAHIAVFTNTTNDPANGRTTPEGVHIQTIWGEIAWQLGGQEAYELVRKNDELRSCPKGVFKKILEKCRPALILIDELADYCVSAAAVKAEGNTLADQTISFMQELTEAVSGSNHCVAVITLPASPQEVGNTSQAQAILTSLQMRVSRVGADTQPVADEEIYEVIRRRLFEDIGDPAAVETAVSKYMELYQQHWAELPQYAVKNEYRQKMLKSYPFHPELIDVFRVRWASHHDFQRTRGALRLLAAIVSDLWKRQQSLPGSNLLIHTSDVNCSNLDALTGQLKKLYGNGYDAVISADVAGSSSNAFKIDGNKKEFGQWYLTQGLAATILVNSFGNDGANKGVGVAELKLNSLRPDGFNHNSVNGALDELESNAFYLYYAQTGGTGKRYWFHTKPNINILINQAKSNVRKDEMEAEILKRLQQGASNLALFGKALVNPSEDIPEQQKPTLIILSPKYTSSPAEVGAATRQVVEKLATQKGNSQRIYRNTLLFLVCSEIGVGKLFADATDYLACQKISQEYGSQLEREQKEEISRRLSEASRQLESSLVVAYSLVLKHTAKNGIQTLALTQFRDQLDAQVNNYLIAALKEEEWLLENVGYNTLNAHQLLPTLEKPLRAREVYEAFLRFDDKPMISGPEAVSNSLQRYCQESYFCIASGDGVAFINYYLGERVPLFDLSDPIYWLVDKSQKPQPQPAPVVEPVDPNTGIVPENPVIINDPGIPQEPAQAMRVYRNLTFSGKIPLERYTELFNYFITPFAMNGNRIEIVVSFRVHSTDGSPLEEAKGIVKNAMEAAGQLGMKVEGE
ncbi:MAG: DUF499 domain-containing protein [Chitinophagales bacterium]|nr:DUF499 domain-containing protein [Chitinophagales bacterium]